MKGFIDLPLAVLCTNGVEPSDYTTRELVQIIFHRKAHSFPNALLILHWIEASLPPS
jgi:hypothetical protein